MFRAARPAVRQVLIYPYWNVNSKAVKDETIFIPVLIYPYWNVNHDCCVSFEFQPVVLIYPYWNVNFVGETVFALNAGF